MPPKSATEIDVHVGKRLRMRRLMVGMSQESLGSQIGLSFQQVQKYENGTNRISASRMQQIAAVLDVPIGFLFEGIDRKQAAGRDLGPTAAESFLATREGLALVEAFTQIADGKVRRNVIDLVRAIAAGIAPPQRKT